MKRALEILLLFFITRIHPVAAPIVTPRVAYGLKPLKVETDVDTSLSMSLVSFVNEIWFPILTTPFPHETETQPSFVTTHTHSRINASDWKTSNLLVVKEIVREELVSKEKKGRKNAKQNALSVCLSFDSNVILRLKKTESMMK